MRLHNLLIETLDPDAAGVVFESTLSHIKNNKMSVFILQRVNTGGTSVSARNLVISNLNGNAGPIRADVIQSGEKSVGHLNSDGIRIDALLIADGK